MPSWILASGVGLLLLVAAVALVLATRSVLRARLEQWAKRVLLEFRARTDRYKLVHRERIREVLLNDARVEAAVQDHARLHGADPAQVRRRVNEYVDEIVPFFNVLSYYKLGYNLSRLLINLLYKASIEYRDQEALDRIPRRDVVVYLMNHRSNADYVVVAYVLARVVSISYAVGEWARVWPLEFVFKSFGSYFIRRRYREPLYHTVLERYVQLVTRNGVTQGIFPEGGLTRDGALRPVKIGLLDYILGTIEDPAFDRDIWLVPVGINYDRVLEDRSLIRERIVGGRRPGRLEQFTQVAGFAGWNMARLLTGQLRRYGRVAVTFGTPISVRQWLADQPPGLLLLPKTDRLPHVQRLAEYALERIGAVIPVTPVPLASAVLLSFGGSVVSLARVLERMDEVRDRLADSSAKVVRRELPVREVWERAWLMLRMRRLVVAEGDDLVILPRSRPLLEYYANSIRHLLPEDVTVAWSPAAERDPTLPRLATREEMDIQTREHPVLRKGRP
ncbi:MAG TPA: 1-acyl-sn-glycerol-3-phosphate acyltransferase [Gemmatimonadales bacterium]|nr:1-acyl-sn-glycerol-3-phosphate acyltransferase [Gemmatimonadales bacterium]